MFRHFAYKENEWIRVSVWEKERREGRSRRKELFPSSESNKLDSTSWIENMAYKRNKKEKTHSTRSRRQIGGNWVKQFFCIFLLVRSNGRRDWMEMQSTMQLLISLVNCSLVTSFRLPTIIIITLACFFSEMRHWGVVLRNKHRYMAVNYLLPYTFMFDPINTPATLNEQNVFLCCCRCVLNCKRTGVNNKMTKVKE